MEQDVLSPFIPLLPLLRLQLESERGSSEQSLSRDTARFQLASSQLGPSQVSVSILTTGTQPQFPHK